MSRRPRDRSRSRDRSRRNTHDHDEYDYNDTDDRERRPSNRFEETPNSTIMIRGLPLHVNESDVSSFPFFDRSSRWLHRSFLFVFRFKIN